MRGEERAPKESATGVGAERSGVLQTTLARRVTDHEAGRELRTGDGLASHGIKMTREIGYNKGSPILLSQYYNYVKQTGVD